MYACIPAHSQDGIFECASVEAHSVSCITESAGIETIVALLYAGTLAEGAFCDRVSVPLYRHTLKYLRIVFDVYRHTASVPVLSSLACTFSQFQNRARTIFFGRPIVAVRQEEKGLSCAS